VKVVLNPPKTSSVVKLPSAKSEPESPAMVRVTVIETCSLFPKLDPSIKRPKFGPNTGSLICIAVAEIEGVGATGGSVDTVIVFDGADSAVLISLLALK
jgi:hypothetical protein